MKWRGTKIGGRLRQKGEEQNKKKKRRAKKRHPPPLAKFKERSKEEKE